MDQTKRCPYCAEEILAAAVKCKHCQSALPTSSARRLLIRWPFLILAALGVAIVAFAYFFTRNMPDVPATPASTQMGPIEAWSITAGLLLVVLAIPGRAYRWLFVGGAVLLILAIFLI